MIPRLCSGCGAPLTDEEIHYYDRYCNTCEGEWSDRINAWRHGAADHELDALYDVPEPTKH